MDAIPPSRRSSIGKLSGLLGAALFATAALRWLGRRWWCEAGDWALWSSAVNSLHNSQHLLDPYALTHVLHGLGLYLLLKLAVPAEMSVGARGVLAVWIESLWEILENTDWVINRYREVTFAFGYYGDSIFNSLGDILACGVGFWLAARLPTWASCLLFAAIEGLLLVWIRDGLLLNILMLIWPLPEVRTWQLGQG